MEEKPRWRREALGAWVPVSSHYDTMIHAHMAASVWNRVTSIAST